MLDGRLTSTLATSSNEFARARKRVKADKALDQKITSLFAVQRSIQAKRKPAESPAEKDGAEDRAANCRRPPAVAPRRCTPWSSSTAEVLAAAETHVRASATWPFAGARLSPAREEAGNEQLGDDRVRTSRCSSGWRNVLLVDGVDDEQYVEVLDGVTVDPAPGGSWLCSGSPAEEVRVTPGGFCRH